MKLLIACAAWPAIIGLALVFFLTGMTAWLLLTIGNGLLTVAEGSRDLIGDLRVRL